MNNKLKFIVAGSLIVLMQGFPILQVATPQASAQEAGAATDPQAFTPKDLPTEPLFRTDSRWVDETVNAARQVMDEMIANRGRDNFLANLESWQAFEGRVARATEWLRLCRRVEFNEAIREILEGRSRLQARRTQLQALLDELKKKLAEDTERFKQLRGEKTALGAAAEALGIDLVIGGFEYLLNKGADKLDSSSMSGPRHAQERVPQTKGGRALRCLGRAASVLNTAQNWYDAVKNTREYSEMKMMLPLMLERTELIAYLEGLIPQYDRIIDAQEELVNRLIDAYNDHACNRCVEPGDQGGTRTRPQGGGTQTGGGQSGGQTGGQTGGGRRSGGGRIRVWKEGDPEPPMAPPSRPNTGVRKSDEPQVQDYPFELAPAEKARQEQMTEELYEEMMRRLDEKTRRDCGAQ